MLNHVFSLQIFFKILYYYTFKILKRPLGKFDLPEMYLKKLKIVKNLEF